VAIQLPIRQPSKPKSEVIENGQIDSHY
jgi:hypothetical protein